MPPRRAPRPLTEADREAWARYAAQVTPLAGRARPATPPAPALPPMAVAPAPSAAPPPRRNHAPTVHIGQAPSGLDARRWGALRRGRLRPERTLDLHGQPAEEAHASVRAFLADCRAAGLRCVAVITGRGKGGGGEGVLRREFPHWLNAPDLRPLILGAAHPPRENGGAVHLLLRRARP